jgi:hypothetical protein
MESQAMPTKTVAHVPISETCSGKGLRTTQQSLNMSGDQTRGCGQVSRQEGKET